MCRHIKEIDQLRYDLAYAINTIIEHDHCVNSLTKNWTDDIQKLSYTGTRKYTVSSDGKLITLGIF